MEPKSTPFCSKKLQKTPSRHFFFSPTKYPKVPKSTLSRSCRATCPVRIVLLFTPRHFFCQAQKGAKRCQKVPRKCHSPFTSRTGFSLVPRFQTVPASSKMFHGDLSLYTSTARMYRGSIVSSVLVLELCPRIT